jgi:hypothetical protein
VARDERHESEHPRERVGARQLGLGDGLGQVGVPRRHEEGRLCAEQEHQRVHPVAALEHAGGHGAAHDRDLDQLAGAHDAALAVAVGDRARPAGQQHEGQRRQEVGQALAPGGHGHVGSGVLVDRRDEEEQEAEDVERAEELRDQQGAESGRVQPERVPLRLAMRHGLGV